MGTALDRIALTPRTPEASTVPEPIGKPGGPGLWHHKTMQLPPYVQHVAHHLIGKYGESKGIAMAVGIVRNWAEGHDGHGHKVHPDVRAAAAKNIAQWEKDRAEAHGETAAKHAAEDVKASALALAAPYAQSMLPKPSQAGTAPGARGLGPIAPGILKQAPSQTVAAAPPLPPGVKLPSAQELDAAASVVAALGSDPILTGACNQLQAAADQMAKGDYIHALSGLRSAQTGVRAAYKAFAGANIPVANVFSVTLQPDDPARQQMADVQAKANQYRDVNVQLSGMIDRIRRFHFKGQVQGYAQARFSGQQVPDGVELSLFKRSSPAPAVSSGPERVRAYERRGPHGLEQVSESERQRRVLDWWKDAHSLVYKQVLSAPSVSKFGDVVDNGNLNLGPIGWVEKRGPLWHATHRDSTELGGKATKSIAVKTLVDYHNQMASQPRADPAKVAKLEREAGVGPEGQKALEDQIAKAVAAKEHASTLARIPQMGDRELQDFQHRQDEKWVYEDEPYPKLRELRVAAAAELNKRDLPHWRQVRAHERAKGRTSAGTMDPALQDVLAERDVRHEQTRLKAAPAVGQLAMFTRPEHPARSLSKILALAK